MANEGPTTVGSIDAKLTVDDSDFKRGMEEAKAEAKEVGALEPTVKVDANVGPALAKLEAVKKAQQDLDLAYQRSAITQQKLDQATKKYGDDSLQAAQARMVHTRALNAEAAAEGKHAGLLQASTAEEEKATEATKKSTDATRAKVTGLQVLLAVAPAAMAALAPLSGAAVGLATSLGVMGAAGVLAIGGIKDAMQVGDSVGQQYSAGMGILVNDFHTLQGVAANNLLGGFTNAVGDVSEKMPFLNQLIAQGAGLLGQMGGTALSGVLNGLQQMNPLIQMGGVELGKFVSWLFQFSNSKGFQEFIDYAQENLPAVMQLIESLVTLAGHLIAAFAPLGPVVVAGLTALANVLNSLPLPVLAGLVTMGTALAPAFTIATAAVKALGIQMSLFGMEANLAVPVVGILLAAITGIGMAVAVSAASTQEGTGALNSYTQALKDDNDALGEHVRAQAARALADAGAFDAARQLGIDQQTLTNSLLGNADAQNKVNDAVSKAKAFVNDYSQGIFDQTSGLYVATDAQNSMGKAVDLVTKTLGQQNSAIQQSQKTNADLAAAMQTTNGATQEQVNANQVLSNQYGTTTAALKEAQDSQDKTAQSTANTTLQMQLQNNAAGLLKAALDDLNGKTISAAQAQNAFDSQLVNMGTHVDKTGKQITFTTSNIGDMSAASVALRGQLNGQVQALQQVVEANGGLDNSTGQARQQMETMRQQIIDNAVAHGVDREAVTQYIDKIMQIPASVPPTKTDVDTANSQLKIRGLQQAIDSLTGKTVDIYTVEHIQSVRDGPAVNGIGGNEIANSMQAANAFATGSAGYSTGGSVAYRADGGPISYLSTGGHPGVPRGTDTVPAWLTPEEFVLKRASAKSIGPAALHYMNDTGQLPPSGGITPVHVAVYVGNEQLDARMYTVATGALDDANRDAARRPSR